MKDEWVAKEERMAERREESIFKDKELLKILECSETLWSASNNFGKENGGNSEKSDWQIDRAQNKGP